MIKCSEALGKIIERNRKHFTPDELENVHVAHGKLISLEEMEEQERLVILPCKVGDTLYAPTRNFISEFRVSHFDFSGYEKPSLWVNWELMKGITGNFRIEGIRASEIGKTVFLTREEAETALKGVSKDV